jgi:hypothetical protein
MSEGRVILGLTEDITVLGNNGIEAEHTSRIDTGATSSSIDTNLAEKLQLGPIIKDKIVKSASGVKTRSVVLAKVKLNGSIIEAEFTLADRGHMTYPLLIGQNILKQGNFLIDPNK